MMRLFLALAFILLGGAARADHFSSQGPLGAVDLKAAQRGFLVYQTVCSGCHALGGLHYRDLEALGLTPDQVAGLAASVKLADGSPATLDSPFKSPPAMNLGGAVPPDLSSIAAQRQGGASYLYRLLTGYIAAPADVTLMPGHFYNVAYAGHQLAMPPPLHDGAVSYADGTPATASQEAEDVAEFLSWTADPNLTARHQIGLRAVIFFVFLIAIAVAAKRRIWRESH